MPFKVIVTNDFDHMSEVAAELLIGDIRQKLLSGSDYVLGLVTGNSPTGLYKHLAKAANSGKIDSSRMISFNLDEYVGLPGENAQQRALHSQSRSYFMVQELFGLLNNKFRSANVPWGTLIDQDVFEAELRANPADWSLHGMDKGKAVVIRRDAGSEYLRWIRREVLDAYEAKIARCGGIDLHIVGVGARGHVGFHEAGIPFEGNRMLMVKLDENTISNAVIDGHFPTRETCPFYAISMGVELVYKARTVILLANGARKVNAVANALLMQPDCSVPVSYSQKFSQSGGRMVFVIDRLAAAKIFEKADQIRKRGIELEDRSSEKSSVPVANLKFYRNAQTGAME